MAKYIVTGGAGFIGSTLTDRLINEGNEVIIIDNLHSGSKNNIHPKAKFIKSNVMKIDFDDVIFKGVDGIYHLGVYSSSPMYKENPFLVGYAINGYINILETVKKNKIPIVIASTSSVYGEQKPRHHEEMDVLVMDFYTEARHKMERLSRLYSKLYGASIINLRLFSVYGKKEKAKGIYANLISQFIWSMKEKKRPLIYGDGNQTRDFTYVDDIVESFVLSMNYLKDKEGICHIINAGTGKSYTFNEVIKFLNKKLGTDIKPKYLFPNPIKNYIMHTLADTSKAEKIISFSAQYTLEQGIEELFK